jgi:hypothetical protein
MEAAMVGYWIIWNHRNKTIFESQHIDLDLCLSIFKESFELVMHRAKPTLKEGMSQWVDTL